MERDFTDKEESNNIDYARVAHVSSVYVLFERFVPQTNLRGLAPCMSHLHVCTCGLRNISIIKARVESKTSRKL